MVTAFLPGLAARLGVVELIDFRSNYIGKEHARS